MCLFTKKEKPYIAKEPITVYKVMVKRGTWWCNGDGRHDYYFPSQMGGADIGETIKAATDKPLQTQNVLLHGDFKLKKLFMVEGQGVHAYLTIEDAKYSHLLHNAITEWEIPAGAKYWKSAYFYNSKGEIAATEMKFIREVKPTEGIFNPQ